MAPIRAHTRLRRWAAVVVLALMLSTPARNVVAAQPARPAAARDRLNVRMISIAEGLPHPTVYAIARDSFGFLWFGTLAGLARYDGHRFVVYRPDLANPNTPASAQIDTLYTDRAGTLWIGTLASGLNRYDPRSEQFTGYRSDPTDPAGLRSNNVVALAETSPGQLWVATYGGGLSRLDAASGRFTSFNRVALNRSSQRRLATYTNLDPGSYSFELQVANGEGVWGAETRRLQITVVPPWWQTWWFNLLGGIAILATIARGVSLRLRGEERQRRRLEAEVAARTTALATANASLERQVRLERTLIMSLELDALLDGILEQIGEVVPLRAGAIFTVEAERLTLHALRGVERAPGSAPVQLDLVRLPLLAAALASGGTQVLSSAATGSDALDYVGGMFGRPAHAQSWLVAPLLVQEHVIGVLVLSHPQPGVYGPAEIAQLEPFVNPVALALENERLRQCARRDATLEERSRLARELHDAVTQTLFSASLIAEAMPDALERDHARAALGAAELHRLTAGALAELRALLIELRPKALTETSLGKLLQLLGASLHSRSAIPITVTIVSDCTLAPAVQHACYRIAQEALNNAVKHAAATSVTVSVDCTPDEVLLRVRDDGRGFDLAQVPNGGLGLGILQERASEIGAQLRLDSEPGAGTTVLLHWQARDGSGLTLAG